MSTQSLASRSSAAVARADLRARVRQPAFLVIVLAAAGLGYFAAPPETAGYTMVKIGAFRGTYDSAYIGLVMALIGSVWLPMFGYYLVKNAIARDTAGVGELLAATPLNRVAYLLGKFLSNLAVLGAMAGALALAAPAMQLLRGESTSLDLAALWLPTALLCVPLLALAAAAALLSESIPLLRGAIGNIAWFFAALLLYFAWLRSEPIEAVVASLQADLLMQHPQAGDTEISIGLTGEDGGLGMFTWSGLDITAGLLAGAAGVVLLAVVLAVLPALWLPRFGAAAPLVPSGRNESDSLGTAGSFDCAALRSAPAARGAALPSMVLGELRLLLKGLTRWWWLGLLALTAAGLLSPGGSVGMVLLFAWLWPVLVWSRLGTQADEHDIHALLGAAPARRRRLLAAWVAGTAVSALAGAGPLLHMLYTADLTGIAAWLGGAVFIPALALLLGSVSRSARLFQVAYLMLWFLILNGMAFMDVMGAIRTGGEPAGPGPLNIAALAAALFAAALAIDELRHARR